MSLAGLLPLLRRHEHRRAHRIPDLAAIEILFAPLVADERLKSGDLGGIEEVKARHVVEEDGPDLGAAGAVEGGQAQCHVNAGLEGLVEGADAVRCEEEDAVEVLEGTEEDWMQFSIRGIGLG